MPDNSKAARFRAMHLAALTRDVNPRETEAEKIQRQALRTHAQVWFADAGNPWITNRDWQRAEQDARNPNQNTRIRERARALTERASIYPRLAKPKPEPKPEPRGTIQESREARINRMAANIRARIKRNYEPATPPPPPPIHRPAVLCESTTRAVPVQSRHSHTHYLWREWKAALHKAMDHNSPRVPDIEAKMIQIAVLDWVETYLD